MGRPKNTMGDFWRHVDIRGDDECWEWQGCFFNDGYGAFRFDGKVRKAHRLALGSVYDLSDEELSCHTCDNRACCNPSHLFAGSAADNSEDMVAKGRQQRAVGEANSNAKLTESEVHFIKHSDIEQRELARIFKVHSRTIWRIKAGRLWGHVA